MVWLLAIAGLTTGYRWSDYRLYMVWLQAIDGLTRIITFMQWLEAYHMIYAFGICHVVCISIHDHMPWWWCCMFLTYLAKRDIVFACRVCLSMFCPGHWLEVIHNNYFIFSGQDNLTWSLCTVMLIRLFDLRPWYYDLYRDNFVWTISQKL